jgi:hypothetical protein
MAGAIIIAEKQLSLYSFLQQLNAVPMHSQSQVCNHSFGCVDLCVLEFRVLDCQVNLRITKLVLLICFSVLSCQSRVLPKSVYKLTGTINLAQPFVLK